MKLCLNPEICSGIIGIFNKRSGDEYGFDSHEFISALKLCYPKEYYKGLLSYISDSNLDIESAFQQMHSEIGRYLSLNSENLHIRSVGKHSSPNYKDADTMNEMWKKI
ncbi:MAG: hypothetical protein HDS75_08555 [Bacteroidales bacterium]|nr:hypothetical protein [Bacteroidales bacterium]